MEHQPSPYRLLIVDDLPAVREALRWALEGETDLVVVGEASSGPEALACAAALAPDVVLVDLMLPGLDGYAVARAQSFSPSTCGGLAHGLQRPSSPTSWGHRRQRRLCRKKCGLVRTARRGAPRSRRPVVQEAPLTGDDNTLSSVYLTPP